MMQYFNPITFAPEEERHLLETAILTNGQIKDFLINCRIILCGQTARETQAVISFIKAVATEQLIKILTQQFRHIYGTAIQFSENFRLGLQNTLLKIIKDKHFRDANVVDLQRTIIDKLLPIIGANTTANIIITERSTTLEFASQIPDFFAQDGSTRERFEAKWTPLLHYLHTKSDPLSSCKTAATGIGFSALLWVTEQLSPPVMLAIALITLTPLIRDLYRTSNSAAILSTYEDDFVEMHNRMLVFKKVDWPKPQATTTARPVYEPQAITVAALTTTPPTTRQQQPPADPPPIDTTSQTTKKPKRSKRPTAVAPADTQPDLNQTVSIGEYVYDPNHLAQSTMFPINGSLQHGVYYVAIHPDISQEIINYHQESTGSMLLKRFTDKVTNNVKFSPQGENLKLIQGIRLPDPDSGSHLCYELRLLGKFGDHRLIGPAIATTNNHGDHACLIELNTYVDHAHSPNQLSRRAMQAAVGNHSNAQMKAT